MVSPSGLLCSRAELNQQVAGDRLAEDEPQFAVRRVLGFVHEIITQAGGVKTGDRIAFRHPQQQFAKWRVANFQLDLAINCQFVVAQPVGQQLGGCQLGQDLISLDAQGGIGA